MHAIEPIAMQARNQFDSLALIIGGLSI